MLEEMDVEIGCVWYSCRVVSDDPFYTTVLMPMERSVSPFQLRHTGLISSAGVRWASDRDWDRYFWLNYIGEWQETKPKTRLSRFSITLKGKAFQLTTFAIKNVWYVLRMLGVFETIEQLEVRNLHEVTSTVRSSEWFTLAAPGYNQFPDLQARSVKRLKLEYGEDQESGFIVTALRLKSTFPSLQSLEVAKTGIFTRAELGFLDTLTTLKHLRLIERTNQELEDDEGPDSIHVTNLLVECMEVLLHPPNLQSIHWNRAGYQKVRCDIIWNQTSKQMELVDIWLTINGEKVLEGERYDGWYFREELFYGVGSETAWRKLWMRRFGCDPMMAGAFDIEEGSFEESYGAGSDEISEAIPW
ncbi:hypothetical protein TWF481_010761 [Arthrobotrys musiformis]|uniref:F-box domain-containing protein n=1 Tax=Arthrobotrys musiformis TaxID=47236 RepID=A0AAV9W1T8_9PEZI